MFCETHLTTKRAGVKGTKATLVYSLIIQLKLYLGSHKTTGSKQWLGRWVYINNISLRIAYQLYRTFLCAQKCYRKKKKDLLTNIFGRLNSVF